MRTHGRTRVDGWRSQIDPTYLSWSRMRSRCNCPTAVDFARYGGRGIKVCARWDSFEAFLADMGERPSGLQLDRIDNDGDYEPGNCRWVTKQANASNRSTNVLLTHEGVTRTATEWGAVTGLGETLLARIRRGWSIDRAISTPIDPRYSKRPKS